MKLVAYDATDVGGPSRGHGPDGTARGPMPLSPWWRAGTLMHRIARGVRREAFEGRAVTSWEETLRWAASHERVTELQIWGHGGWGFMDVGRTRLDREALASGSELAPAIDALREVLAPGALVWLRCCSAFGARAGREFAPALAERLRARVAGHTYVIHALQSGTHAVARGDEVAWPTDEGVVIEGGRAMRAKDSMPFEPNTLTCFRLDLPSGW
ncbi:MAG: DUF4347 domain-containing protein [Polyangiales bacterium]